MPAVEAAIVSLIVSPDEALQLAVVLDLSVRSLMTSLWDLIMLVHVPAVLAAPWLTSCSPFMPPCRKVVLRFPPSAFVIYQCGLLASCLGNLSVWCPFWSRLATWYGLCSQPSMETCTWILCSIPVEAGELFGSAALEAPEWTIQVWEMIQQFSVLSRSRCPSAHSTGNSTGNLTSFSDFCGTAHLPTREPQIPEHLPHLSMTPSGTTELSHCTPRPLLNRKDPLSQLGGRMRHPNPQDPNCCWAVVWTLSDRPLSCSMTAVENYFLLVSKTQGIPSDLFLVYYLVSPNPALPQL